MKPIAMNTVASQTVVVSALALVLAACGGGAPPAESPSAAPDASADAGGDAVDEGAAPEEADAPKTDKNEFAIGHTGVAKGAKGVKESTLKPSATESVVKFVVEDKETGPTKGVVISLAAPDGKKYFTEETDETGFAEVLVPAGVDYALVYLSLGRGDVDAKVTVPQKPNQTLKLTLRYKKRTPKGSQVTVNGKTQAPGFVLAGVTFDTAKATIKPDSLSRLDSVLEFMTHKKSARILISGHTDNVGKPASNKALSEERAKSCRAYLVKQGIEESRIEVAGFGDEKPIAENTTEEGRQQNRRIEAVEL